jgi:hypothetical protein
LDNDDDDRKIQTQPLGEGSLLSDQIPVPGENKLRVYVLCRFAAQSSLYLPWMNRCALPVTIVSENLHAWELPADAGIVITHMHYRHEEIAKLREIQGRHQVPVLILSDGILEYRNTWEHPDLPDASIFQPLCGHKLACIGRGQARVVESWGNVGKCEVVGLPRLDGQAENCSPVTKEGPFRLLIATANTPSFNEQQRKTVIDSLTHIRKRMDDNSKVNGRDCKVTWRLTDGLEDEIGLAKQKTHEESGSREPLSEVIDRMDAVITTPSTLYLESILRKRPTAVLDFHNRPHYVPAAWTINAPIHFNWTLRELADPPGHKLLFQDSTLHDQLECDSPATDRLLQLIDAMVQCGQECRAAGESLKLPARILPDERCGFSIVPASFDLEKLYENNEVFQVQDIQRLQVELNAAIDRLGQMPAELVEKNELIVHLTTALEATRLRANRMKDRVYAIRQRLGIKPNPNRSNESQK